MVSSAPIDEHAVTQALRMHIRPLRISANVHQPQSQVLHFLSYEMKHPFEVLVSCYHTCVVRDIDRRLIVHCRVRGMSG